MCCVLTLTNSIGRKASAGGGSNKQATTATDSSSWRAYFEQASNKNFTPSSIKDDKVKCVPVLGLLKLTPVALRSPQLEGIATSKQLQQRTPAHGTLASYKLASKSSDPPDVSMINSGPVTVC